TRTRGSLSEKRRATSGVSSEEPSSTTTSSQSPMVCACTLSIVRDRNLTALCAGITTETLIVWPLLGRGSCAHSTSAWSVQLRLRSTEGHQVVLRQPHQVHQDL